MNGVSSIAVSGMQAATTRLSVAASNIVNQQSDGPVPSTSPSQTVAQTAGSVYQPLTVSQTSVAGGGVSASVSASLPSYTLSYDPTASYADAQVVVASPNVDDTQQMMDVLASSQAYKANAKVFEMANKTEKQALDMIA